MSDNPSTEGTVLPCPFCSHTKAPKLMTGPEINEDAHENCPVCWAVCCRFQEGGCGATGGFEIDGTSALERWNARPSPEPAAQQVDEGKLWSFLRKVLMRGADIDGDHQGPYEMYSAKMDEAAREAVPELLTLLSQSPTKSEVQP